MSAREASLLFVLVLALLSTPLLGQSQWMNADIPGKVINIQQVVSSDDGQRVYYGGMIRLDSTGWQNTNPVMRYDDGQWDTLGVLRQIVYTMVEYHDTLIASGAFDMVDDSLPVEHVAYWTGQQWLNYGSFQPSGARKLRVLDDTLYAAGTMDTVNGQFAGGLARRIGGHWEPIGTLETDYPTFMVDIVKWNGQLVAIGPGSINNEHRIFWLNNGVWSILGGGIQGGLCSAQCLAVFQGDLYVGGQITMACGNVGQGILRWDGSQWQPVGLGLQYALGDFSSLAGASTMAVHDNKLYVGGGFRYAGGVEAQGLASWDGVEWCGVPGNFSYGVGHNGINRMAFYHDTLFVAANMVDEDSVNFAAKFIGTSYEGTCTGPLAIAPQEDPQLAVSTWEEAGVVHVRLPEGTGPAPIHLLDLSGRMIQRTFGTNVRFTIAHGTAGIYVVQAAGYPPRRVVIADP